MSRSRNTRLIPAAVAASAALTLGGAYINAELSIHKDVRQLIEDRAFAKRLNKRIESLGDEVTLYHMLEQADPGAEALWFEGLTWTYGSMKTEVNLLARFLHSRGVRTGVFVALFMTNSPEMVFTVYALAQLGAVPALINTSLRNETLSHCVGVSQASLLIATADLVEHTASISTEVPLIHILLDLGSFGVGITTKLVKSIEHVTRQTLLQRSGTPPRPKRNITDVGCLIYTSGTSGKPKGVAVKSFLLCLTSTPLSVDLNDRKRYLPVRTFSCLPLFHATAFLNGLAYSVGTSGCFCVGRKFSASKFSKSLVDSRATRMQYVGELCRYLVATPPTQYDKAHACIVANGNGLQKDIWTQFMNKFHIAEIREIYRSTEGIAKFDNLKGGAASPGKVGFSGPLKRFLETNTYLVKYDAEREDLYRNPKTGFCVLAALDEPGEAIGRVQSMSLYPQYHNDPKATELKLVRDVFRKGDLFQRTGDLLIQDRAGWVRFHDRIGDTFRWKGENVSAGEVRAFISDIPNVQDVIVYGVKLDGYEGHMGATGITLTESDPGSESELMSKLYGFLRSRGLPDYAIPRLVRITKKIAVGATFKHAKEILKKRSWHQDLNTDKDTLYWLDGETYKSLDVDSWRKITALTARL